MSCGTGMVQALWESAKDQRNKEIFPSGNSGHKGSQEMWTIRSGGGGGNGGTY